MKKGAASLMSTTSQKARDDSSVLLVSLVGCPFLCFLAKLVVPLSPVFP